MNRIALLSSRSVLRINGPDSASFLQGVVTQNVERAAPGEALFSALLTPQGKILFDFIAWRVADGFLLDIDAGAADAAAKRLSMYRLRAKVEITPEPALAVGAAWPDPLSALPAEIAQVADPRAARLGWRLIGPRALVEGATGGAETFYDAHRLDLGVPAFGRDFASDEMFALDVGYDALNGVDYKKGCFVGQEVTSRMKRKGGIRKRPRIVTFESPDAAAKGTQVIAGDGAVGEILSARDGVAIALMRLDRLAAAEGAPLTVNGDLVRVLVPHWLEQG